MEYPRKLLCSSSALILQQVRFCTVVVRRQDRNETNLFCSLRAFKYGCIQTGWQDILYASSKVIDFIKRLIYFFPGRSHWGCQLHYPARAEAQRRTYSNQTGLAGQRELEDVVTQRGDYAIPTQHRGDRGHPVHSRRPGALFDHVCAHASVRLHFGSFRRRYPCVLLLPSHEVWTRNCPGPLLASSSHWDTL